MRRDLYSRPSETPTVDGALADWPAFGLDYGHSRDGRLVTVYDDDACPQDLMERWISCDARYAVPLEEVA